MTLKALKTDRSDKQCWNIQFMIGCYYFPENRWKLCLENENPFQMVPFQGHVVFWGVFQQELHEHVSKLHFSWNIFKWCLRLRLKLVFLQFIRFFSSDFSKSKGFKILFTILLGCRESTGYPWQSQHRVQSSWYDQFFWHLDGTMRHLDHGM